MPIYFNNKKPKLIKSKYKNELNSNVYEPFLHRDEVQCHDVQVPRL